MRSCSVLSLVSILLVSVTYAQKADEVESNGAVPGLMSPTMEFQFASRMEGKTLFQIGEDVVREGRKSIRDKQAIQSGPAQGMRVTGVEDKSETWMISGIGREIVPIQMHIHRITRQFKESEKLNAVQEKALEGWLAKFDGIANRIAKEDAKIDELDKLSDILLLDVSEVFDAVDRPDVHLLEAAMMAQVIDQRLYQIDFYFDQVLKLYRSRDPRTENISLVLDGVGIHPSQALAKKSTSKAVTGLGERYGSRVEYVHRHLKSGGGEVALIEELEALQRNFDDGKLTRIEEARNVMDKIYREIFSKKVLAPVALRVGIGMYTQNQQNLIANLIDAVKRTPDKEDYVIGGIRMKIFNAKGGLSLVFIDDKKLVHSQLDSLIRLAEETRDKSKLEEKNLKILNDGIEALKKSKDSLGKEVRYRDWANWTNAANELHTLFKF